MLKLKTKRKQFVCFEGIDVIKAREALGLTQSEVARKCNWSLNSLFNLEHPEKYIVIPDDFNVVIESNFALLQGALKK